jgi:hypothetical protein
MALTLHDYLEIIASKIEFMRTLFITDTDVQLKFADDADVLRNEEAANCFLEISTFPWVAFIGHCSKSAR